MALSDSNIVKLLLNTEFSDNLTQSIEQHKLISKELDQAYHAQDENAWLCDEDNPDAKAHDAYIDILRNVQTLIVLRIKHLGGFDLSRAYGA